MLLWNGMPAPRFQMEKEPTQEKEKIFLDMASMFANKPENLEEKAKVYAEELKDLPTKFLQEVMSDVVREDQFFPAFASIYQKCLKLSLQFSGFDVPDVYAAWKECKDWIQGNKKNGKTPIVELTIRVLGKKELKKTTTENIGYVKNDFEKAYNLTITECQKYVLYHLAGKEEKENPRWNLFAVRKELIQSHTEKEKEDSVIEKPKLSEKEKEEAYAKRMKIIADFKKNMKKKARKAF